MKYERFEQLPVWQTAITLAEKVYILTQHRAVRRLREWKDQIRRASLSVSNNIAEGFERGTTAELLSFLYIARGSAGETRSLLLLGRRLVDQQTTSIPAEQWVLPRLTQSEISDLKSQISATHDLAESCSRQIRGWADQLQNSDIQGQRRLNAKTRQAWKQRKSTDAFMEYLQKIRDDAAKTKNDGKPKFEPEI